MASETLIMEWIQRSEQLYQEGNTLKSFREYFELQELEEYMVSKGFKFTNNTITDSTGEILWKKS